MDAHCIGAAAPGFNTPANPSLDSSSGTGGAPAGLIGPTNDNAPGWQAEGVKGQREAFNSDCEGSGSVDQARADKRFSNLRASLAIVGYVVSQTRQPGGAVTYQASRWGMTRALETLMDVEAFALRVGVTS